MAEYLQVHPETPPQRHIRRIVECLKNDGVIIYPTDTVYGLGCNLYSKKGIERIRKIKGIKPNKMHLSFICHDLSELSQYAMPSSIGNTTFRMMKKYLPGPYTFILKSNRKVPKIFGVTKKQVGIRVPNHPIPRQIVQELGNPIVTTSVKDQYDDISEYMSDPSLIYDRYQKHVDLVIDGGFGGHTASSVILCDQDQFEVLREGAGEVEEFE